MKEFYPLGFDSANVRLRTSGFGLSDGDRPSFVYVVVDFVWAIVTVVNNPVGFGEDVFCHWLCRLTANSSSEVTRGDAKLVVLVHVAI